MSKFNNVDNYLNANLSNLNVSGFKVIQTTTENTLLDSTTNKIKTEFIPNISLTNIYVVADDAARLALIPSLQSGDSVKQLDNNKYYVFSQDNTFVEITTEAPALSTLSDVEITSLTSNQYLKYDTTTSKWINASITNSLSGCSDVTITSPANNNILQYDSTASKWKNQAPATVAMSDLTDVVLSSLSHDSIAYDVVASTWKNQKRPAKVFCWVPDDVDRNAVGEPTAYIPYIPGILNAESDINFEYRIYSGDIVVASSSAFMVVLPYHPSYGYFIQISAANFYINNLTGVYISGLQQAGSTLVFSVDNNRWEGIKLDHDQLTSKGTTSHADIDTALSVVATNTSDIATLQSDLATNVYVTGLLQTNLTTKGDLWTHTGLANSRLGVGTDGQILTASSISDTGLSWTTPSGGGSSTLSALTDCTISSPSNNQLLKYDTATSKWINSTVTNSLSGLTDCTISTPSNNQLLKYDTVTSKWINATVSTGATSTTGLSDFDTATPSEGDKLRYTSGKWTPYTHTRYLTKRTVTNATITVSTTTKLYTVQVGLKGNYFVSWYIRIWPNGSSYPTFYLTQNSSGSDSKTGTDYIATAETLSVPDFEFSGTVTNSIDNYRVAGSSIVTTTVNNAYISIFGDRYSGSYQVVDLASDNTNLAGHLSAFLL